MPQRPRPEAREDDALALLVDEVWDLNDAIRELEARRDRLRADILLACRSRGITRWSHARGALRIDRYASYRAPPAAPLLPTILAHGWEDRVLTVKGRALHALAKDLPDLAAAFRAAYGEVRHEVLVMTPSASRARR